VPRRKFEDEDLEDDDVKDDWEEEDEEPKPAPVPAPEPKKRMSVKQKIAEKEAMRQNDTGNDFDDWDLEESQVDETEQRRKEKEAQMRSDLDNAAALLGSASIDENREGKNTNESSGTLASAKPSSKEDWEAFAKSLYETFIQPKASLPGFDKHFFPQMLTLLTTQGLRDVDMRKGSTKLRELAENKVKMDKEFKKTGGNLKRLQNNKPKQVVTNYAKNDLDLKAYGDEALDDDLDFM